MLRTITSIYSLLAAVAILLLGSGLLGTVVALRAGIEQFPTAVIGLVMAGFFLGYVLGSYLCPHIVRSFGHIRSFSAFAAIGCASVILHGLWIDPLVWIGLRILTGICMLGMYLVIESWLSGLSTNRTRGGLFAVYMTINLLALGAGQFLILVYGVTDVAPFALSALFFSLALVPIALTRMPQPTPVVAARLGLRQLYATSPLGSTGALVSGMVSGGFWGMGPVFAVEAGFTEAGIAMFMSGVIFGGALLQWPLGHLSDNHDRRMVMLGVSLAGGLAATAVFLLVKLHPNLSFMAAVLFGGCAFSIYSLSVAHANDHANVDHVMEVSRGLLLLSGIGASLGPILAGLLMGWAGAGSLMAYFALLLTLLAVFTWFRRKVGAHISTDEQGDFVMMARTSSEVLELDPRAEGDPPGEPEPGQK
ncbi:MAG: MFS transporter [Gammaproteobacteria bacterium]|nr:MFS transporter [Gammaproteobacteria bacterium]